MSNIMPKVTFAAICSRNPGDPRCPQLRQLASPASGGGGGGFRMNQELGQKSVSSLNVKPGSTNVLIPPTFGGGSGEAAKNGGEIPPTFTGPGSGVPPTFTGEVPPTYARQSLMSSISEGPQRIGTRRGTLFGDSTAQPRFQVMQGEHGVPAPATDREFSDMFGSRLQFLGPTAESGGSLTSISQADHEWRNLRSVVSDPGTTLYRETITPYVPTAVPTEVPGARGPSFLSDNARSVQPASMAGEGSTATTVVRRHRLPKGSIDYGETQRISSQMSRATSGTAGLPESTYSSMPRLMANSAVTQSSIYPSQMEGEAGLSTVTEAGPSMAPTVAEAATGGEAAAAAEGFTLSEAMDVALLA